MDKRYEPLKKPYNMYMKTIFNKLFLTLCSIVILGTIGFVLIGYIFKLEMYPEVFILVFISSIIGSFIFAAMVSHEYRYIEHKVEDHMIKAEAHEILLKNHYFKLEEKAGIRTYQLKYFPNWIYKEVKVIIKEDEINDLYIIIVPKYLLKRFK